ncbi:MAG: hypothetical protein AAGI01_12515 [Myxococcota bacterium]
MRYDKIAESSTAWGLDEARAGDGETRTFLALDVRSELVRRDPMTSP